MAYAQPQVIEVVEYIDDDDWDGDEDDYEEVVEIVEQVVMVPKLNFSAVKAYEVGIGAPPPLFLTPKEKSKLAAQQEQQSAAAVASVSSASRMATVPTNKNAIMSKQPTSPSKQSPRTPTASKRLSARKRLSIVNQALQLPDDYGLSDYDEEEISDDEEIIEEEYYDDEEVIEDEEVVEDEYYEEEAYDDDYIIEEVIEETEEEAKARKQLEAEIALIEQQIEEAKKAKVKRLAEGGIGEETSREKAQRMAHNSRLQACKQMKVESEFKRKATARAKVLAEKEKDWGKKGGKKKQKDLSEIIASKAKKQQKLLTRQKSRDGTKTPIRPVEQPQEEAPKPVEEAESTVEKKQLSMAEMLAQKAQKGINGGNVGKAKASQCIKSAAADDFGDDDLRAEDFLPSDDEEEEQVKEPELTPEEQHRKRLEWQKPTWTQAKLKTTTKGTIPKRVEIVLTT
jgi:hypothetical protein